MLPDRFMHRNADKKQRLIFFLFVVIWIIYTASAF